MKGLTMLESPGRMEKSCALSGLSIANIQVDEMDDGAKPHFVLHFGRCNQSEQAPRLKRLFVSLWKIGGRSHQFEWDQTGTDRLHYITSQESLTKATRPFEMAMMLEITTDGPCGLRQWLCRHGTAVWMPYHHYNDHIHTDINTTFAQRKLCGIIPKSFLALQWGYGAYSLGNNKYEVWASDAIASFYWQCYMRLSFWRFQVLCVTWRT